MNEKFEKLPLKQDLIKNLAELQFDSMTPIQASSLLEVLGGVDVIAQAKTGSGKTAVFGLGILNSLDIQGMNLQALILCPTRELAEQVAKEIRKLARMLKDVKILTLCGGTAEYHQERSLFHGAHVIVGTPGRVLRLLKKGSLRVPRIKTFVLDEADRMLDMGFHDDIMAIVAHLPRVRQSLLFSATFPDEIVELGKSVQRDATYVKVDTQHAPNAINQIFYELESHKEKNETLLKILAKYKLGRTIVFCKTKQITNDVAKFLNKNSIFAEAIHGDLMQNERTSVLTKFSNHSLSVLVATDVAARGLDITELPAVINFDLPTDAQVYIHRIGRTGRAGKTGQVFSLFLKKSSHLLDKIEDVTHTPCEVEDITNFCLTESNLYDLVPPMKTMYIGGGKRNNLRPGDILGALTGDVNLNFSDVGEISIYNIVSYVAIKRDHIDHAVKKLQDGKIKNRKFKVGLL
ncbi:MAG: ATP-dependent RNA helicase DbpA [Bacteriovoracaceae bacterium]|nr:ATP-dependent RNA helicase DbpA [Bacteriovoracaceae bacterium]